MSWNSYKHPISDIRDWNRNHRLELKPDFQRNEVWTKAAQIMLIDTIIRGIPIPKIYIKSIIHEGNTYRVVLDGQQRLTAILKFVEDKLKLGKPYEGEYFGKTFSELPLDVQNDILRYTIDINEIFNPTDDQIRDLYARVNKYTVQLNKQELRKADFPGDFISLSEELSEMEFFEKSKIFSVKQRRRMLDVEYIEELLSIMLEGIHEKKEHLDSVCEKYMIMNNKDDIYAEFVNIIGDISKIFEPDVYPISQTRFKQKSDFYSLFACVFDLRKIGSLNHKHINDIRNNITLMTENVGPQSEIDKYREYAMRCLSDANSVSSRKWRVQFLKEFLEPAYIDEE